MLAPRFNDSLSTDLTDERRRPRHERSARRAAVTNRIRRREQAEVSAAPTLTPRRIVDPLALTEHLATRKVAEIQETEQEWRARLQSVSLRPGPEDGGLKAPRPAKAAEVSDAETAARVAPEL